MPNAARLVAAVSLALIAFILSGQIMPLMPEGTGFGYFTWINVALGLLVGWIVMGKRAGRGTTPGINNGLTGVAALIFWGLFVQGCYEMFRQATRNRFDSPFEAVLAIFEIAAEYGMMLLVPPIIATVLIGGVLSGLATEFAWRRWR
ncbi:TrgA family protein [Sedimentitalea arenosa]|uniref:TrgA family protein n=1 Tax=Sedimentitalea arenosa TaxID=2798803 RepID=A0A8J7LQG0_9RHOB|nr:TrgA family protein [Arenibacterium arenosum]MBJ6370753.1 TrgA family protein [Arenibacterium arenosum]